MIKFGMNNTLLTFRGQYFKYRGSTGLLNNHGQCQTIEGYKYAWLGLLAAFILEKIKEKFKGTKCFEIYCDNGLMPYNSKLTTDKIKELLEEFHKESNEVTG